MSKKRKKKKRRKRDGWPRKSRRKSPSASKPEPKLPAEAANLTAVQNVMHKMQSGRWDVDEVMARFERLTQLFRSHPQLSELRPPPRRVMQAFAEFEQQHKEDLESIGALPQDERRELLTSFVAPRIFSPGFVRVLRESLMEALMAADDEADAEALVLGLLAVAEEQFEENPLWQCLISVLLQENAEFSEAFDEAVHEVAPETSEESDDDPEAWRKVMTDPEKKARLMDALGKKPIVAKEVHRRLTEIGTDLSHAIEEGEVDARLTEEELRPVTDAGERIFREVKERYAGKPLDDAAADEVGRRMIDPLVEFAKDSANRPAFQRFGQELAHEAEQAAADGEERAGRLASFAHCWRDLAEHDALLRVNVIRGSMNRLAQEKAAEHEGS